MTEYEAEKIVHDILEAALLNALDLQDEGRAAQIETAAKIVFTKYYNNEKDA